MTYTEPAMTPAADELPVCTSTAAIRARDFNSDTTDPNRDTWTIGLMRHVIAALGGHPVVLTNDKQTGHTVVGVRLVDAFHGGSNGPRLSYEWRGADGATRITNCWLPNVGDTITPLTDHRIKDAKWRAIETVRKAKSDATAIARALIEPAGREYGTYSATIEANGVHVRYEPHANPPAGKTAGGAWSGLVADGKVVRVTLDLKPRKPRKPRA